MSRLLGVQFFLAYSLFGLAQPVLCFAQREAGSTTASWTANPELVAKASKRKGFNYQESAVPSYSLPNHAVVDGQKISREQWQGENREKLLNIFREQVYGWRPESSYKVKYRTVKEQLGVFDGKADGKQIEVVITREGRAFVFPVTLFVPASSSSQKAVPAIVHINNRYFISLEKAASEPDPFWPVETIVSQGFATASFHTSDVDPDNKDGYSQGIRSFLAGGAEPKPNDWRSLSAWGWGASRVADLLAEQPQVNASQIAVSGHSRGGKAALWAAAEDKRFATAYSNNSGCGGAALSRRRFGETVARITTVFPHWFNENFAAYGDREDQLPIDQHEVIGLIAPRGVYVASSDEDLWADPRGEFLALASSRPYFEIFGASSISNQSMPGLNGQLIVGQTGYHIRQGGHGLLAEDWERFLKFYKQVL